jgi:hypothetical protein
LISKVDIYFDSTFLAEFVRKRYPEIEASNRHNYYELLSDFIKHSNLDSFLDLKVNTPDWPRINFEIFTLSNINSNSEDTFIEKVSDFHRKIRAIVHFGKEL